MHCGPIRYEVDAREQAEKRPFEATKAIIIFKSNIHQKFAVIDQRIVWYGSINLLSYGSSEESIMRLDSLNIANELIGTIDEML